MEEISDRLRKIRVKLCEDNNGIFAEKIGTTQQQASNYISGIRNPSGKKIDQILEAFPEVNRAWLILGEGAMLVSKEPENNNVINSTGDNNNNSINNGSQVDAIVSMYEARLADKDALIEYLKKSVEHLSNEVKELRQWTHMCADRYIATLDDIKATTEDTNELVKECKQHIGFKK